MPEHQLQLIQIVAEVAEELENENIPYEIPEQGIMIETPAAVMLSEELAESQKGYTEAQATSLIYRGGLRV